MGIGNWLFRALVTAAAAIMVASFILPWWIVSFSGTVPDEQPVYLSGARVEIFAYGLRHDLHELAGYIVSDETPPYQTVLAFAYLGTSVVLSFFALRLKNGKSPWLITGIGLVYIAYTAIAVLRIFERTRDFGIVFQGSSLLVRGLDTTSSLQPAFYLACAAGVFYVCLGLLGGLVSKVRRS